MLGGQTKRLLQAASAAVVLLPAASASSADFDWSGFYAGGHIGLGLADGTYFVDTNDIFFDRTYEFSADALRFGILGGYNHVAERVLVGIEADVSFGEADDSFSVISNFNIEPEANLRLRFGLPHEHFLPFVTMGAALAVGNSKDVALGGESRLHPGVVAGTGLEIALTGGIALRGEYLFQSFGKAIYEFGEFDDKAQWDEHVVRAAMTYKLNR